MPEKEHPDVNDTLRAEGVDAVRARHDRTKKYNGRDAVVSATDLKTKYGLTLTAFTDIDRAPVKAHLVQNFLGAGELSCMFGPPGAAKSVLAGDIGAHVAWGQLWFGRRVMRSGVLYVAAERPALVKRRLAAFRLHHNVTDLPLAVVSGSLDLRTSRLSAEAIIEIASRWSDTTKIATGLIMGDTTSRLLAGGDENSPKDMGAFIANVTLIQERTGAHVMLLHHVPHETNRMRGHGLQVAAMDTTISVEKNGGIRTATIDKNADGEEGAQVAFDLLSIEISKDPETGAPTMAPVVRPVEGATANLSAQALRLTKNQQTMFSVLHDAGRQGLTTRKWDERARAEGIGVKRRADLYDLRGALNSKHLVRQYGERWTIIS